MSGRRYADPAGTQNSIEDLSPARHLRQLNSDLRRAARQAETQNLKGALQGAIANNAA
jgi:hypothetical protein